jgi:beta-lactamase regulating signal transducer with metallopeptidase domain
MTSLQLLTGPLAQALGWALLHLLWQATLVAGILAAVLALMSRQSSNSRYVVSCGALALIFTMFVATTIRAYDPAAAPIALSGDSTATAETVKVSLKQLPVLIAESAAQGVKERAVATLTSARNHLPSIVAIWLLGVVLLSSRLLVSWVRAKRLIHLASRPASREWQRIAAHLSQALGLRRAVTLLESAAVEVPSVIGSLRPIILLPASALTGMTPEQIEMVLAHEMAHIRRHDFLTNLLQAVVETLMFYHPAVWWISRQVRVERENCCDDLAVAVCGNPIQYARALTRLEELRANALPTVVAANGGSLLERIRRIAAGRAAASRAEGTTSSSRWAAAVAMLAILGLAVAVPSLPALAERQEQKKAAKAKEKDQPQKAETRVEVVEERTSDDVYDDTNVDVDVDTDVDTDVDFDYDYDHDVPEPPEPPEPLEALHPMLAPVAIPGHIPTPRPAIAPRPMAAPMIGITPAPMVPPMPPVALAALAPGNFHWDDDDDDEVNDRELGSGGKLSVDELISLRASGVTPEYVASMRGIFPGLTLRQVTGLGHLGVTPEFVKEMRSSGFDVKTAREATSLKAVGVTPEWVREMRSAGYTLDSAREATSMRAVGVTPAYIREMKAAGFDVSSAKNITSMRAVGVTPEFIRDMRSAGFEIKTSQDATSLSAVGVTAEWVRGMRAAGVKIETAKDATSLRALGVTPEFVKKLAAAGYSNLTTRELSRLAAAGVDDDFIRDMEQYRKKN